MMYGLTVRLLANENLFTLHNDMLSQGRNFPTSPSALGNTGLIPDAKDNRDTKIDIAPTHPRRDPSLGIVVTERVRDGCGLRKERGKRAEADRERIGRASKRTGSRRTWLQLVRCALVHTGVLFRKSRSDRKGNRGNRSRYSDWRYRRKHLSIYTNYVFHMEQVRRDREWKS